MVPLNMSPFHNARNGAYVRFMESKKPLCGLIASSEKAPIWEVTFLFIHSNNRRKK